MLLPIMVPIARRGTQNGAEHKSGKWGRSDGRMDGWVGGQTKVEREREREGRAIRLKFQPLCAHWNA